MKNSKPTFFTSDWHIGHANVIKYDDRPFKDIKHMERTLINNYNSTVPKNGICYFLGDMGMGEEKDLTKVLSQLNGTKVLLLGNHDKGMNSMYNSGFDVVLYSATIYLGSHKITMSHCPMIGVKREPEERLGKWTGSNWHGEHKNTRFSVHEHAGFHLHGHVHSPPDSDNRIGGRILDNQFDVGVRANKYTPVSMSTVESWIAQTLVNEGSK